MKVGFSLSPGGLLLPYHLGVLDSLQYHGFLNANSPIAGASAGAIAVASHVCGVDSKKVLDATISISDRCLEMGGARGRLLPLLKEQLDHFIKDDHFEASKDKTFAITYRELFPNFRAVHQTEFEHREELFDAICHSSMFPFFATNWPVRIDTSNTKSFNIGKYQLGIPRVLVDGFFAVPRNRFGCPDFNLAGIEVDRTVVVSPFPQKAIGLDAHHADDCISPDDGSLENMQRLLRLATKSSSAKELIELYDSGFQDAERWCRAQSLHKETIQSTARERM